MASNYFKDKVCLITGASGSIGSALAKTLIKLSPKKLIILDQDETGLFDVYEEIKAQGKVEYVIASIREKDSLDLVFTEHTPDIVFHAAAYKHVVLMEKYANEAFKTNVRGTVNLLEVCKKHAVKKFIFISSDKAVNPSSVMGNSKAIGERLCLEDISKTKKIIVRFGNVMPSRGSVVPIFQKQINEGKNLTVTSKFMERYFMGIYDAVKLILKATEIGKGGEIMVLDMGKPILIEDLAKLMIKISGKPLEIEYSKPSKGEKYKEELMTSAEKKRAHKVGDLYVIKS